MADEMNKNTQWNIYELANPRNCQSAIDIAGHSEQSLKRHLTLMLRIRMAEQRLAKGREQGVIGGPVHLGVGQEAIAAGVSDVLTKTDRVFGAHRSHSHVIAQGASLQALFAEVLGKNEGLSKGMGGSMHLWDQGNGFYGSVPIVAGTVSLAVGAGLAAKLQGTQDVGVAYLGDGAVEEGVVHESLNLASSAGVPVLFVVENNLFASHMHISQRQPLAATARFAEANHVLHAIVDGNDVVAVRNSVAKLVKYSREQQKPVFLEAVTYRWYGHVDWREDIDVGVNRSTEDVQQWRARDPIKRLVQAMIEAEMIYADEVEQLELQVKAEVDIAWENALQAAYPEETALLGRVYATRGYEYCDK